MVAKACSVVLWGWGDGVPVPAEALAVLARDVGPPMAVEQAKEVYELFEVKRQLEAARRKRDRRHERGVDMRLSEEARERARQSVAEAQEAVDELTGRVARLHSALVAPRRSKAGLWRRVQSKLTGSHGRLLPICFVTYRTSSEARAALRQPTATALAAVGVRIGAAPRPTDIQFSHLHMRTNSRLLQLYDAFAIVAMVPLIGMAILVATGFAQMCLFWVPMNCLFSGWCPAEKWYGGLSWLWGIFMFMLVYEVMHQLQALPLGDGGLWPRNFAPLLKDWYHSRTMGQFRFVKVVGATEMLVVFFCVLVCVSRVVDTFHEVTGINLAQDDVTFAHYLCDTTCLCWWINPNLKDEAAGSWYDFGAGFGVNAIVNCLIGDAVLNSFAGRHIGGWFTRHYLAKREPTQHLMDEAVRSRDPYYLPWRIIHLIKLWFFTVVLWPLVPLVGLPAVAYLGVSFAIDRVNLLTLLEPPPPSSGLIMRFVLSVLMPAAVPVHLVVALIGYHHKLHAPTLGQPKLVATCLRGALLIGMGVDMAVHQARIARARGLLTPWQVFLAAFRADGNGFEISSRAEPFPDVEASLEGLSADVIQELYRPPISGAERRDSTPNAGLLFAASDWNAAKHFDTRGRPTLPRVSGGLDGLLLPGRRRSESRSRGSSSGGGPRLDGPMLPGRRRSESRSRGSSSSGGGPRHSSRSKAVSFAHISEASGRNSSTMHASSSSEQRESCGARRSGDVEMASAAAGADGAPPAPPSAAPASMQRQSSWARLLRDTDADAAKGAPPAPPPMAAAQSSSLGELSSATDRDADEPAAAEVEEEGRDLEGGEAPAAPPAVGGGCPLGAGPSIVIHCVRAHRP